MSELMLINPSKRKRSKKGIMPAGLKKYWAKRRAKRTIITSAKRNPIMAKKKRRSRTSGYTVGKSRIRRRKLNPVGRAGRFSMQGFTKNTLMPSAIGAVGALGIDIIIGFLPLPAMMKTGPMRTVAKIVGAAAIGTIASNFMRRDTAQQIAAGAITVALYDLMKGTIVPMLPVDVQASLNEMPYMEEYPSLEYAGAGQTVNEMDEYVSGDESMGDENVGMYVG